jgi:acyl carrier protein
MTVGYADFCTEVLRHVLTDASDHPGPDDDFYDDLGWDSLQVFEVIVATENLAGGEPPEDPPLFMSMRGAYDYFVSLSASRPGGE